MEYATTNAALFTGIMIITIIVIFCVGIAVTRVTKSEFLKDFIPALSSLIAVLVIIALMVAYFIHSGNVRDENSALITDTVTSKFGEFTVKNENVKALYPDSDYDIELKSRPKETCRLNTADKPTNITVECGTFTPAPQQQ